MAIIAEVPFVDVVTTMLDESIPLTTGEFEEWGDPKEKEAYERMLSYSPYDNVKDQAYPAMLVGTGFHDSQVQYWEPAKWVLRLRDHQQGEPILMHANMEAGHGGASDALRRQGCGAQLRLPLWQRAGEYLRSWPSNVCKRMHCKASWRVVRCSGPGTDHVCASGVSCALRSLSERA